MSLANIAKIELYNAGSYAEKTIKIRLSADKEVIVSLIQNEAGKHIGFYSSDLANKIPVPKGIVAIDFAGLHVLDRKGAIWVGEPHPWPTLYYNGKLLMDFTRYEQYDVTVYKME